MTLLWAHGSCITGGSFSSLHWGQRVSYVSYGSLTVEQAVDQAAAGNVLHVREPRDEGWTGAAD